VKDNFLSQTLISYGWVAAGEEIGVSRDWRLNRSWKEYLSRMKGLYAVYGDVVVSEIGA